MSAASRRIRAAFRSRSARTAAVAALVLAAVTAGVPIGIAATSRHHASAWPGTHHTFWPERSWREVERRLAALPPSPRMTRRVLGTVSYRGASFPIHALSFAAARTGDGVRKVLLVGSVHGTESAGAEAILRLAAELAADPVRYPGVSLDMVPIANPWGWAYGYRYNGDGEDVNRDFASHRTREAAILRRFIRASGPYDLVMDLHESRKTGYFLYQYLPSDEGLDDEYQRVLAGMGKPRENGYREGIFRTADGVLRIPTAVLPWIAMARRLSLEHYTRLHGTRHSYTVETPLSDVFPDRVEVHARAVRAFMRRLESGS